MIELVDLRDLGHRQEVVQASVFLRRHFPCAIASNGGTGEGVPLTCF
jgi:hypothetical protein